MIKKWRINTLPPEEQIISDGLKEELKISSVLCDLLVQRGITTFDEAKDFFRPTLSNLIDPLLMKDMSKAVKRLNKALKKQEKILIYGDYDVDGTTSVAMFFTFLNRFTSNIGYYVPNRYSEGYGISITGIDYAHENGYSLIIALDCGIKAVTKVAYAKELGIDFIICDHHTPSGKLPEAVAVLDPKREDCDYPYKHLSGCGVGFKLAHAFAMDNEQTLDTITPLLDLLAVSIASDIVPIDGENRILAHYGIERLNMQPSLGLAAIIEQCNLSRRKITTSDIVFKMGPRINASGRIESGVNAVKLMVASNKEEALLLSQNIDEFNETRKTLDKDITGEAIQMVWDDPDYQTKKSIVLYNENWNKGVIGIVASRIVEEHYRPTIILTKSNGKITGSARSVSGFNLYEAIYACREHLETFGGHKYAAGMTLKEENIKALVTSFDHYVAEHITEDQLYPHLNIDCVIKLEEINPQFCRILKQFAPHGPKNLKPVFMTKGLKDCGGSKLVGAENIHLKADFTDPNSEASFGGIGFNQPELFQHLKNGGLVDVCYTIEENHFNGKTIFQMLIKDLKIHTNEKITT